jgi:hypothetical protein
VGEPARHFFVIDEGWVLREHSGHDPNQEMVDAEYKLLREKVLPLTRSK